MSQPSRRPNNELFTRRQLIQDHPGLNLGEETVCARAPGTMGPWDNLTPWDLQAELPKGVRYEGSQREDLG
jgi:hypothetical protein